MINKPHGCDYEYFCFFKTHCWVVRLVTGVVRTLMTEIFAGCESAWNDCMLMPMIWCACELDYGTDPQKSHILFCLRIGMDFLFVCFVFVFF